MPKHDYMIILRIQMHQSGCTCKGKEYQAVSDRLCKLLSYIRYQENLEKRKESKPGNLPPSLHPRLDPNCPLTSRPFLKHQNNQKLCLSFCHSLVSQLTSFFCAIYSIICWVIYQVIHPPNIHSVSNPCNISLGCVFW